MGLTTLSLSMGSYDHDRIFGTCWAEFVDRFYKGFSEQENVQKTLACWTEQVEGWCHGKNRDNLDKAMDTLMANYYQTFSPKDGCRAPDKSELWLENDRFHGKLDGLSDEGIVHEVKSTSRAQSTSEQLWKVQNSLQVRLYAVLAKANGVQIEFAYKDAPYALFRGPIREVSADERGLWEQELNSLADYIVSLGDDPYNYPCHTDGCCYAGKWSTNMCPFQLLCEQGYTEETSIFYKSREQRHEQAQRMSVPVGAT